MHPDGVSSGSRMVNDEEKAQLKYGKSVTGDIRELQEQLEVVKAELKKVMRYEDYFTDKLDDLKPLINSGLQEVL
jgi:hypothetical protein